jgi:DNA-binding response OmpR family regulator
MPFMNGNETSKHLNNIFLEEEAKPNSTFSRPKICCVSAHTAENIRLSALDAGMDDYLTKPTTKSDMGMIL